MIFPRKVTLTFEIIKNETLSSSTEFQMLDGQLDALNAALDNIEQKNDDIHAQLIELLHSNREIRRQMQNSTAPPSAPDNSKPTN